MNKNTIALIMLILALVGSCASLYKFIEDKDKEVLNLRFKAIDTRIDNIDQEQDRQWTVINENSQK